MERKKTLNGIQMKLILFFVSAFFIISLITGVIQYNTNAESILKEAQLNVVKLAKAGSLLIDGDRHEKLLVEEDMLTDDYQIIRSKMQGFMKETEVSSFYTLTMLGSANTQFIVDADEENQPPIGEEYHYMPDMAPVFQGTASAERDFYTDEWGTVLSGYAPLRNSKDEIVAIVAVDLDVSYIIQQKNQLITRLVVSGLVGMILMIIISIFISRKITKPINELVNNLSERFNGIYANGGDLTNSIEIKTGDEIELLADSISNFIGNIRKAMIQVKSTGENVSNSASILNISINENQTVLEGVNTAIENIASGASDQARDVSDVSSGIQEISKDMDENEIKVNAINTAAGETRNLIITGLEAVNNQSIKTDESMEAFQKVTASVDKLTKEIEDVEKILSTITNISEQTNLLALNAAIEAARAGEYGRGFAVVAEEVRKLAEESTISTKEIAEILENINKDAGEVVDQIGKTNVIAKEQKNAVDSTSLIFNQITKEVESVIADIGIINTSFKLIGDNTNSISDKIQNVAAISEENAAMSEEVSASSEEQYASMEEIGETAKELNHLSDNLAKIISSFKI